MNKLITIVAALAIALPAAAASAFEGGESVYVHLEGDFHGYEEAARACHDQLMQPVVLDDAEELAWLQERIDFLADGRPWVWIGGVSKSWPSAWAGVKGVAVTAMADQPLTLRPLSAEGSVLCEFPAVTASR